MASRKPTTDTAPEALDFPGQVDSTELDRVAQQTQLNRMSDAELRAITTFEEANAYAVEAYGGVDDVSTELGNGFTLLGKSDKAKLVGKPFLILFFTLNAGDFGAYFSTIHAMTTDNRKVIINDGSTGIHKQLADYADRTNRNGGLMVPNGLRRSEYPTCSNEKCEKPRPPKVSTCQSCGDTSEARNKGVTFYLETADAL